MKLWMSLLATAGTVALATGAGAAPILISGTGTWAATAATTARSAPNATFSFSFTLPDPIAANPTTQVSGFSYTLNGATVTGNPTSLRFYNAASSGMFDINFSNAALSLYGADIGSTLTITPGTYAFTIAPTSGGSMAGTGTLNVGAMAAVPEPATWAMMIVGAGLAGVAMRRRRSVTVRYA